MVVKEIKFKKNVVEPVFEQIARTLKQNIIQKHFPSGSKLPPEPQMALQFGVSRPTLRKSLKLLEEQNLIIQRKGRGTFVTYRGTKKRRIALVVGSDFQKIHDSYTLRMLAALNIALQSNLNNELLLLDNSNNNSLLDKLHASISDGLICITDNPQVVDELFKPEFSNLPIVLLNNRRAKPPGHKLVSVLSNPQAIEAALAHLSQLGHRKIAYLAAPDAFSDLKQRNMEFINVRKKYGISQEPSLYVEYTKSDLSWYEQARKSVHELFSRKDVPTAVICPNACISYGAWQGLMECNMRIPQDVSIIGFDCDSSFNPNLSTISQSEIEMGKAAGKLIMKMLNKNNASQEDIVFDVKLEERGSCASPAM